MDVLPGVVDNGHVFWVTSKIYCLIMRCVFWLLPPTTHPKLKLATGMSACQRPLAVQHHMDIDDYTFHQSYVAQWQSVWPQIMRSAVRITGKPMVLKVWRNWKKLKLWSVSYVVCGVWWKVGVQRRWTRYAVFDMSFSVDLCVRKHAKVYGANLQPCFND